MSDEPGPAGLNSTLDPDTVRFVLVQPQFGGNVGSAARAMKNLGFARLTLVDPRCDPLGREARMMAVEAADLLERAEVHPGLSGALAGARTVVGTTRRIGKHRRPHWRLDGLSAELCGLAARGELAILFGREDHGLSDADLDRCTHLVYFPAAADYPSFNLAQAVLLVAYELRMAGIEPPAESALPPPATDRAREAMYRHLEQAWRSIGFVAPDTAATILRRVRRMFGRAALSAEEVTLLRGVARQTLWVARKAGLPIAEGPETDPAPGTGPPAGPRDG